MNCPQCNQDNSEDARFCAECGALLAESPLALPRVDFVTAVKLGFSNYFIFKGRSTRAEYWWWALFAVIGSMVFNILGALNGLPLAGTFSLVTLIPELVLVARRLHDINRTGWWQLLIVGSFLIIPPLVLLVLATKHGDIGPNKHGQDPRQASTQTP